MATTQQIPVPDRPGLYAQVETTSERGRYSVTWTDATIDQYPAAHMLLSRRLGAMELPERLRWIWGRYGHALTDASEYAGGGTFGHMRSVPKEMAEEVERLVVAAFTVAVADGLPVDEVGAPLQMWGES